METRQAFASALGNITDACCKLNLAFGDFQSLILSRKKTTKRGPFAGFCAYESKTGPANSHYKLFRKLRPESSEVPPAFEATDFKPLAATRKRMMGRRLFDFL